MNNECQMLVAGYEKCLEMLERQKQEAKSELIRKLKEKESVKSQEFVDWYYWETDFDLDVLKDAAGFEKGKVLKYITTPYQMPYKCRRCKQTRYHSCNSRTDARNFLKDASNKRTEEYYYCQQCKDELENERKSKLVKRAQAKEERVKGKTHPLRTMPYDEYLQTKHWKTFSKERMREADYKCKKCGRSDIELNVHHLTYERRGCELVSDVVVLCKACHLETHNRPVPKYLVLNPVPLSERARQAISKAD